MMDSPVVWVLEIAAERKGKPHFSNLGVFSEEILGQEVGNAYLGRWELKSDPWVYFAKNERLWYRKFPKGLLVLRRMVVDQRPAFMPEPISPEQSEDVKKLLSF